MSCYGSWSEQCDSDCQSCAQHKELVEKARQRYEKLPQEEKYAYWGRHFTFTHEELLERECDCDKSHTCYKHYQVISDKFRKISQAWRIGMQQIFDSVEKK